MVDGRLLVKGCILVGVVVRVLVRGVRAVVASAVVVALAFDVSGIAQDETGRLYIPGCWCRSSCRSSPCRPLWMIVRLIGTWLVCCGDSSEVEGQMVVERLGGD